MNRRSFIARAGGTFASAAVAPASCVAAAIGRPLRINRIVVQTAPGRRLTPVAPNAYAPFRGFDVTETILRIQTSQGLEGIAHANPKSDVLRELLGKDPHALFSWDANGIVAGSSEEHRALLGRLAGADVALLDLLGKALNRPVAALLGKAVRQSVPVYDSSLYMEDLPAIAKEFDSTNDPVRSANQLLRDR